ncbi:MAG: asparagine synthetase B [Fibrobacteria bacterium]|nr:asparagine synthetase B [Fibrobacteria bacterium]
MVKNLLVIFLLMKSAFAGKMLIPMDGTQSNHLKAYGIAFLSVASAQNVEWLLNYRGGSFLLNDSPVFQREATRRGVVYELISENQANTIYLEIDQNNMEKVLLEKEPRVAVYTPPNKQPWDDAVTMVLSYAEIPYKNIYDKEVLDGTLNKIDWIHLHHEDFTGQNSKFYRAFRHAPWYIQQSVTYQKLADELGFPNNPVLKKAVVLALRNYVENGGFLFAMCSACNTLDIALSAVKTDVVGEVFDNTPVASDYSSKIDYSLCFAFTDFKIDTDPYSSSHGNIDYNQVNAGTLKRRPPNDFYLFDFSPKYDPVPAMLTQNHSNYIKGFYGLATSFRKANLKKAITILGEVDGQPALRYIHGNLGEGQFVYYGGHDPEDVSHAVGDPPTDLNLHKNSPGYRLILNNVLYPAARKKKRKT